MAAPNFNLVPGRLDINAVVGNDFTMLLDFNIDLTGYTFDAQVILQNIPFNTNGTFTVSDVNLSEGRISINLTDIQTRNIGPLANTKWYFSWSIGGNDRTVLSGNFTLNQPWAVDEYSPTSSPVSVVIDDTVVDVTVIGGAGGSILWGDIQGDIEDQADLITLLDGKVSKGSVILNNPDGSEQSFYPTSNTNSAREASLREALSIALDGSVITLSSGAFSVTSTSLSSSLSGDIDVKFNFLPNSSLIYSDPNLSKNDRSLFYGSIRDVSYFGAHPNASASQNISSIKAARNSLPNFYPGSFTTNGDDIVNGTILFSEPYPYFLNESLHFSPETVISGTPGGGFADLRWVNNFAPSAGSEKFAIYFDKPDGAGNANSSHNSGINWISVTSEDVGNEKFSGINFLGAQIAIINGVYIGYRYRGFYASEITTFEVQSLWINGFSPTGDIPSTSGFPAFHLDGCLGVDISYMSIGFFTATGTDSDGDLKPQALIEDCTCVSIGNLGLEDCSSGLKIKNSVAVSATSFLVSGQGNENSYALCLRGDTDKISFLNVVGVNVQNLINDQSISTGVYLVPGNLLSSQRASYYQDPLINKMSANSLSAASVMVGNGESLVVGDGAGVAGIIVNGGSPNAIISIRRLGVQKILIQDYSGLGQFFDFDDVLTLRANVGLNNVLILTSTTAQFLTSLSASNLSGTNTGDQYGSVTAGSANLYLRRNAANTAYEFGSLPSSAPSDATFITQTPSSGLSSEQALSALSTGLLKNTTSTGVLTIAAAGTDYVAPSGSGASLTGLTSAQIAGTTTNDNATAGNIGEYVSSLIASGSAVSLTDATAANVTSISLTAGDWDVEGNINFIATTATVTSKIGGISSTSAAMPTDGSEVYSGVQLTVATATDGLALPRKRISIASTTTVYLVGQASFSAGTVSAFGSITARRVR